MREILFRGKRADNGTWTCGYLFSIWERYYLSWGMTNDVPNMEEIIPETVGEYTGLTDKNGRKIFEGDIVRTKKYGKVMGHVNVNDYDTFRVVYEPAVFRLVNSNRAFNLLGQAIDWEVIGNFYDNPELLEGGDDNG